MTQTQRSRSRTVPTRRISFEESLRGPAPALRRRRRPDPEPPRRRRCRPCSPTARTSSCARSATTATRSPIPSSSARSPASSARRPCTAASTGPSTTGSTELGYPTKRVERFTPRGLALRERLLPPIVEPGRHRRARALHRHPGRARAQRRGGPGSCSATTRSRNLFLWHALEESEHKAVAFDVYRAVGGSERIRVLDHELMRFGFVVGMAVQVLAVAARRPRHLPPRPSCVAAGAASVARRSCSATLWHQLRDYNRPDFHPDDRDTTELVERVAGRAVRRRGHAQRQLAVAGTTAA